MQINRKKKERRYLVVLRKDWRNRVVFSAVMILSRMTLLKNYHEVSLYNEANYEIKLYLGWAQKNHFLTEYFLRRK